MPRTYITREDRELNIIFRNVIGERKMRGISQKRLAEAIGLSSQQGYNAIEKRRNPTLRQFLMICHELDVEPSEILKTAEDRK